jgi:hypothetical protein
MHMCDVGQHRRKQKEGAREEKRREDRGSDGFERSTGAVATADTREKIYILKKKHNI